MIIIGLTGSIGMGKSTASNMLRHLGIPVHDSDEEVHALLSAGGRGVEAVMSAFPVYAYPHIYSWATGAKRSVNRKALGKIVFKNAKAREKLEAVLHPLVREAQSNFIRTQKNAGHDLVTLDIPLLFETGGENLVHYTLAVTAPPFIQKARVLSRAGMTEDKFYSILASQMPDTEKRARADFVVHNGLSRAHTMRQIRHIVSTIRNAQKEGT